MSSKLGSPEPLKRVQNIVNMQSDAKSAFCKKVIKRGAKGSILEAFGVTLEDFGHQRASQRPFFERLKF